MKKLFMILIIPVLFLTLSGCASTGQRSPEKNRPLPQEENPPILGADKDEHGCIGSAGYSWCEPKNKCLRIWEEACYADTAQEIQNILAKKYDRPLAEVKVAISKEEAGFASGSVLFGQGGPGEGGIFLAHKVGNMWEVVFDGNGNIDCQKMRQVYDFPDSILKPNFCD